VTARHGRRTQRNRATLVAPALFTLIAVAIVAISAHRVHGTQAAAVAAAAAAAQESVQGDGGVDTAETSASPTPHSSSPAKPSPSASAAAVPAGAGARLEGKPGVNLAAQLAALAAANGAGGVSLAAVNTVTGASISYGAGSGMYTGSIIKLNTLQTLLLQDQDAGTSLSDDDVSTATAAIENSSNDAQETMWAQIGSDPALAAANARLGPVSTVPGTDDFWGLTTTSAADQITLLRNLVRTGGPLTPASQSFILNLMRNVESDQRWGAGVVADAGTTFANKNGWLGVDDDDGKWLVNSDAIVTIHGQQVLISILTQHNADMDTGVALVEALANAIAPAVAP
jgi:hypothetical protein